MTDKIRWLRSICLIAALVIPNLTLVTSAPIYAHDHLLTQDRTIRTFADINPDTQFVFLPLAANNVSSRTHAATPASPCPVDGAVVSLDIDQLSWDCTYCDPGVAYRVALEVGDPTPDEAIYQGPDTTCPLPSLEPDAHYYWQVVTTDTQGATTVSPVWEFTTEATVTEPTPQPEPDWASEVVALTNAERAKVGCSALTIDPRLTEAAVGHSQDMAINDYFSHTSPDGRTPWDRIHATGYTYSRAAENIAAGYASPESVVSGWMNSDGHRANILNCALSEIGVGYVYHSPDTGSVNYCHYWTQVFATP